MEHLNNITEKLGLSQFNDVEMLQNITKKIGHGLQPAHLILGGSIVLVLLLVLNFASYLICSLVGFLYPAYMSFKALESQSKEDDQQWLSYWIVFSFLTVFDGVLTSLLQFLPAFYLFKCAFYVYLFHPQTRGALYLYDNFFKPLLKKYESDIDKKMAQVGKQAADVLNQQAKKL